MVSLARDLTGPLARVDGRAAAGIPGLAEIAIVRDLGMIAEEWRAFEAAALGHVFQTYDFVAAWMATVGRKRQVAPRIVVGRDHDGATVFILPFGIRRCAGVSLLEWIGGEHADYHGGLYCGGYLRTLAADPEAAAAMPRSIVSLFRGEADVASLRRQPAMIGGVANPFAAYAAIRHATACHFTRLGGDWEAYYRAKRNSSSRRNDRGKWTRMEGIGALRLVDATTAEEARRIMAALFDQKGRALAAMGVGDFFADPGVRAFYETLACKPYPDGPGHVAALYCGDEVIAANWGLVRGDRYYYVMHSIADGEAARQSPGRHLMYHLMRWAIAHKVGIFDFTIGDEDFKSQWCEESAPLFDSVAALTLRGTPIATTLSLGKRVKRAIKTSPALYAAADQARRWLARVKR
jgi:CelD/BcsL family acetyltransferase involved in cellulose biosynthesis